MKEKQNLEKILSTNGALGNEDGASITTKTIRNFKEGKEYALVSLDTRRLWTCGERHYHFGAEIWLVHKPQSIVEYINEVDYNDGPFPEEETFTNLGLLEEKNQVTANFDTNKHKGKIAFTNCYGSAAKTIKYQWVATTKQGDEKPTYKIKEIK